MKLFTKISPSLNTILMVVFSLVISIMMILMGTVISLIMEKSIINSSTESSEQLTSQTQFILHNYFSQINSSLQNIAQSRSVVELCKYSNGNTSFDNLKKREEAKQQLLSLLRNQEDISNSIILGNNFFVLPMTLGSAPLMKSDFIQTLMTSLENQKYATITYHSIAYPTYYYPYSDELEIPISLMIRDYSKYDTNNYGILLASLKVEKLDDFVSQMTSENGQIAFILDESDHIYYSSNHDWIGKEYKEYLYSCSVKEKQNQFWLDSSGKRSLLETSKSLELNGWRLILISDMSSIHSQINAVQFTVLTSVIVTLIIIILISLYLTHKITFPLAILSKQMETMNYQALSEKLNSNYSYKEINRLYAGYNQMLDHIESLINDVYYEQLRQKDAQYEALQAKINPHFLYNTLQSITSLAILDRNDDIETVTTALSGMLEYLTYEENTQVFFEKELEYIKRYIQIQQVRYANKYSVIYEIEPQTLSCKISKLLIQPIVENAIKHGFETIQSDGILTIRVMIQEKNLFIEIQDNGRGMDEETLNKLIKHINNPNKDSNKKSIGLSNVQERIRLKFGDQYGLSIQSNVGLGTTIQVKIPAVFSENQKEV